MPRDLPIPSCPNSYIRVKVPINEANFFQRVIEGYTHLGFATTYEPSEGVLAIFTTPDTFDDMMIVLNNYPKTIEILETNSSC